MSISNTWSPSRPSVGINFSALSMSNPSEAIEIKNKNKNKHSIILPPKKKSTINPDVTRRRNPNSRGPAVSSEKRL